MPGFIIFIERKLGKDFLENTNNMLESNFT